MRLVSRNEEWCVLLQRAFQGCSASRPLLNRMLLVVLVGLLLGPLARECQARSTPRNGVITRRVLTPDGGTYPGRTGPAQPRPRPRRRRGKLVRVLRRGQLVRWLNEMLERFKLHLAREKEKKVTYRLRVIDDGSINAMALADGRIYVTRGLLTFVESDDEMAAVLAHECAHVELRHHPKRAAKQMLWQTLAMLGAALAKADGRGFVGATMLGSLATLSYSRQQEYEADRVGFSLLEAAGYNPTAMADFISRLLEWEKEHSKFKLHPIFSTHPPTESRVRRIEAMAEGRGPFSPKVLTYDPGRFIYGPMQGWSDSLEGLSTETTIVTTTATRQHPRGDVLGSGSFEHRGGLPSGWTVAGEGAHRVVRDRAALGVQSLKLWASGGTGLTLTSPTIVSPMALEDALLEYVVAGPLAANLLTELIVQPRLTEADDEESAVRLEPVAEIQRGMWHYRRFDCGALLTEDLEHGRALQIRLAIPPGRRGAVWLDELRFGAVVRDRILSNQKLSGGFLANPDFEETVDGRAVRADGAAAEGKTIPGWHVLVGTGRHSAKGARKGSSSLELRPLAGERRVVVVSDYFARQGLYGGYMLLFFAKASVDTRLFAGLETFDLAEQDGWKPAGGTCCGKTWKRLRVYEQTLPDGDERVRVRFEFAASRPDFVVTIDEVSLVSLLKSEFERSE